MIWIGYSSLKTQAEFARSIINLPIKPIFVNYTDAFAQSHMGVYMLNSLRNTVISVFFIMMIAFVTGYFLSRFTFFGRNLVYGFLMFGMLIPIHALLIPIYIQFNSAGIDNQWYTLLLPYITFGLPIATFLVESHVGTIPRELEEAASIDGSSFSRTLFQIIAPMCLPILTTVAIISFFSTWNEFAFALVLIKDDNLRTVPIGLTFFKAQYTTDYPRLMAAIVIAMSPVMILYFTFSQRISQGMTAGAIKG
jgi:raffinose/stachyose/melibiose transport system permease protein